jgi:tRNA/rRNA methyltransferase
MTPRDFGPPTYAAAPAFAELAAERPPGRVRVRLRALRLVEPTTSTPATPASRSRPIRATARSNLAQAVQLVAYDWRQALGGYPVEARYRPRARSPTAGCGARPRRALGCGR